MNTPATLSAAIAPMIWRSGVALRGDKSSERLPLLSVAGAFMVRSFEATREFD